MARVPIAQRPMTAHVGNYAAPVDTAGVDPEMLGTLQNSGAGSAYVAPQAPKFSNPFTQMAGLGRKVANTFRNLVSHTHPK